MEVVAPQSPAKWVKTTTKKRFLVAIMIQFAFVASFLFVFKFIFDLFGKCSRTQLPKRVKMREKKQTVQKGCGETAFNLLMQASMELILFPVLTFTSLNNGFFGGFPISPD